METLTNILELLYFLSGPAIFVVAIIGLKQITVTKENRQISSKRESFKLAAEQCKFYIETIIPLLDILDKKIEENDLDFFNKSQVNFVNGKIEIKAFLENSALDKVYDSCIVELQVAINYLESFSMFFVSGLASEKVGFNTVGRTFTKTVKDLLPFLVIVGQDGDYKDIIVLYGIWNTRIEKEKLEREKANIEEKLNSNKEISIEAIGTR